MPIPLKTALIGRQSGDEICPERLIILDQARQSFDFDNVSEPPLLSINRNFSAPVIMAAEREGTAEPARERDGARAGGDATAVRHP